MSADPEVLRLAREAIKMGVFQSWCNADSTPRPKREERVETQAQVVARVNNCFLAEVAKLDKEPRALKHEGYSLHRLSKAADNPREVVFANAWKAEAENLGYLIQESPEHPSITQRDASCIATIVQWLGSNVGWSFLNECVEKIGYRIDTSKRKVAKLEGKNVRVD